MRRTITVAAVLAVPLSFGLPLPAAADPSSMSGAAEDAATAAAVRAITDPRVSPAEQTGSLPAGFGYRAAEYRSAAGAGYAIDPRGECSSLVPLPADFAAPCQAHDLGYDLLRYAHSTGRPLGGWARTRLDARSPSGFRRCARHVRPSSAGGAPRSRV
ncbi:hypothetical protein [Tsukamurella serpentis]